METKRVWVTREELYKQAWSEPLQKLSKQYGLSDVGLAKICRKLQIPLPGVGYWQKKQYGKPAQQAPLPPPKGDLLKAVEMSGPREPAAANPEIDSTLAFERLPENRINVSPVLTSPHPYVARTGDILKKSKPDQKGFVALKGRKCLGIRVSPENIDRALRLMDALVKAMEVREFNISLDSENEDVSSVEVLGEVIEFTLEELVDRTERELTPRQKKEQKRKPWLYRMPEYDYHPSGTLSLSIKNSNSSGVRKNWRDGKTRIEEHLNKFIIGLVMEARKMQAERLEREQWHREREERERLWAERERLRFEEEQRLERLEKEIAAWQKSQRIRAYVQAVRDKAIQTHGEIAPGSELDTWISWATKQADRFDPLVKNSSE